MRSTSPACRKRGVSRDHRVTHRAARLPLDKSVGSGAVDNPTSQGSTYRQQDSVQTNGTGALQPLPHRSENMAPINNQGVKDGIHQQTRSLEQGKLVGQKSALKPKDIWAIRIYLQNDANQQSGMTLLSRAEFRCIGFDGAFLLLLRLGRRFPSPTLKRRFHLTCCPNSWSLFSASVPRQSLSLVHPEESDD
jgi:hypothetical protein